MELAKKITAERGMEIDQEARKQIIEAMYVDDYLGGGSPEDVQRMRGETQVTKDGKQIYTGTLSQILSTTGFQTKAQVVSKQCTKEESAALGEKALGIPYSPTKDMFEMKLQPSITVNRKRGTKVVAVLGEREVEEVKDGAKVLSKRAVLSFLMGNFDPLGLLTPLVVRGKILLRRLYGPDYGLGWDDPIPKEEQDLWAELLQVAVDMKPIPFTRTVRPSQAVGGAWLIGFGDGSLAAFAATLYMRWRVGPSNGPPNGLALDGPSSGPPDGPKSGPSEEPLSGPPKGPPVFWVNLLLAKARVSTIHGTSTPRAEMQSLVMMMRLILTAVKSLPFKIEGVVAALDSQYSIAATEKSGGLLGPYFANRVNEYYQIRSEIEELVNVIEPLQHVPGNLNGSADICTRGRGKVEDLGPSSTWEQGPSFLRMERDQWPLSREFRNTSLPKEELRSKH